MIYNDLTAQQVKAFLAQPAHALIVNAPVGFGKRSLMHQLAASLLDIEPGGVVQHPAITIIQPVKNSIGIEVIRDLRSFSKLRSANQKEGIHRIILIEDAQGLTREAQNAFLKLLEEPPADLVIIMTVSSLGLLLPTIISRAQLIHLKPVPKSQVLGYFSEQGFAVKDTERAYHLSDGRLGLMHAILQESNDHPLLTQVQLAKEVLTAPAFERLQKIDELSKDKANLSSFLQGLHRVVQAALAGAIDKNDARNIERWKLRLQQVHKALDGLVVNANTKLLLTDLLLNL
ncbi:MAG: holB: polymerase delta subunit [Candidatus Saccharibacteria bacterium]|nr:holB: polymerase delta subunit [Candidatus Saccharibacteria bacterium]